jgi:hypothetical protein
VKKQIDNDTFGMNDNAPIRILFHFAIALRQVGMRFGFRMLEKVL